MRGGLPDLSGPIEPAFSRRALALALIAATAVSVLISAQNTLRFPGRRWIDLLLFELPLWYAWVVLSPLIVIVSRHFPLVGGRWIRSLPVHLVACALAMVTALTMMHVTRLGTAPAAMLELEYSVMFTLPRVFGFFVIVYFAIVALEHAFRYHEAYSARLVHEAELRTLLARSELESLRLQLQPHFLFNTLNTVSSLMSRDVAAARQVVSDLGELLRSSLRQEERHDIELEEELDFVAAYVRIQRARFGPRLDVWMDVEKGVLHCEVPRMLLQPLVENAIVHGDRGGGAVTRVVISASHSGTDRLRLCVSDNGPGFPEGAISREGIGTRNTRVRLAQLYGTDHRFEIRNGPDGGAEVLIELPARPASSPPVAVDPA